MFLFVPVFFYGLLFSVSNQFTVHTVSDIAEIQKQTVLWFWVCGQQRT